MTTKTRGTDAFQKGFSNEMVRKCSYFRKKSVFHFDHFDHFEIKDLVPKWLNFGKIRQYSN